MAFSWLATLPVIGDVDEDLANLRQLRPQPRVELVHCAGELAPAQVRVGVHLRREDRLLRRDVDGVELANLVHYRRSFERSPGELQALGHDRLTDQEIGERPRQA